MIKKGAYESVLSLVFSKFDPIVTVSIGLASGLLALLEGGIWIIIAVFNFVLSWGIQLITKRKNWPFYILGITFSIISIAVLTNLECDVPSGKTDREIALFGVTKIDKRDIDNYTIYGLLEVKRGGKVYRLRAVTYYRDLLRPFEIGDLLSVVCEIEPLTFTKPYEKIMLIKGIRVKANCSDFKRVGRIGGIEGLRLKLNSRMSKLVEAYLKPPLSSLLLGMLIGSDEEMPKSFSNIMQDVGLTHIVVVSGYNISLIYEAVRKFLSPLGRKWTDVLGSVCLYVFVWLVGGEPPVLRAALMSWSRGLAAVFGRTITPLRSLFLSTIVMLMVFPRWIESVSFHLSFLATFAILNVDFFVPSFIEKIGKLGLFLKNYLFQTLVILLFTVPYTSFVFGKLIFISLISNILVLPFVGDIMGIGLLAITASCLSRRLGELFFAVEWVPLWYVVVVSDWLSGISRPVDCKISLFALISVYLLLLLFMFINNCRRSKKHVVG